MKKGEKLLFLAGILLAIGALAFSAWKLRGIYGEYQEGEDTYEELSAFVEEPEDTPEDETDEPEAEPSGYLQIDFAGLQAVNPDVIAWIDIPGLSVSYPVVQRNDNAYYLHHLITGEYNSSGSIFADCHNQPDFTDQNTIIYGHNMKNGSMFGTLSHYQDQALWEENPIFTCMCRGKCWNIRSSPVMPGMWAARLTPMRFRKRMISRISWGRSVPMQGMIPAWKSQKQTGW